MRYAAYAALRSIGCRRTGDSWVECPPSFTYTRDGVLAWKPFWALLFSVSIHGVAFHHEVHVLSRLRLYVFFIVIHAHIQV